MPSLPQLIVTSTHTYTPQGSVLTPSSSLAQRLKAELASLYHVEAWVLQRIDLQRWEWPFPQQPPQQVGILVASQQGIHGLAGGIPAEHRSQYRLLVVGRASATLAQDYGFLTWPLPPEPSTALASVRYLSETQARLPHTWLWGHGTHANPEASQWLKAQGYTVQSILLYTQQAAVEPWPLPNRPLTPEAVSVVWTAPSMVEALASDPTPLGLKQFLLACRHISFSPRISQCLQSVLQPANSLEQSLTLHTLIQPSQPALLSYLLE
ncbi:MAG: hypothetical protein ACKO34_00060 [Vampirovibrionales bacterium]